MYAAVHSRRTAIRHKFQGKFCGFPVPKPHNVAPCDAARAYARCYDDPVRDATMFLFYIYIYKYRERYVYIYM